MKHSEPLILNKEEFFEGFDNPSLQEKVVGVKIALLQNDNGEIGLGLGIEAPPLHSREIEEINRFFAKKYNANEMMQKLLQHYQDQRSQSADSKNQSDQKYEITDIAHPQYPWLHRIRALQDVREDVHQGDLGGFVESERNLSQEGSCWIFHEAIAAEDAVVAGDAQIRELAVIRGSSMVSGSAVIRHRSIVEDNAIVTAGIVEADSRIAGNAKVIESPWTQAAPYISNGLVYGNISGNVRLCQGAQVLPGQVFDNPTPDELRITDAYMKILRTPERENIRFASPESRMPAKKKTRSETER